MPTETRKRPLIPVPKELSSRALDRFEEKLGTLIAEAPADIGLDCSALDLVSSSHVNVLWAAREKCEDANIPLRLHNVSSGLTRILAILDLTEFFLFDEQAQADTDDAAGLPEGESPDRQLGLSLRSSGSEVMDALQRFRQFLKDLKVDPMCALELETVFYETLTNISAHGDLGDHDTIKFNARVTAKAIEMTFTDTGREFDPTAHIQEFDPQQAIKQRQRRGLGLTMIARLTDSMDYERSENRCNVLKLKKYWS